jgi:diaminohydroxyphosphoribosylaminopyrimidine deaminase/5-amino-6-(5-phosphoribosylamino)uracil reductase
MPLGAHISGTPVPAEPLDIAFLRLALRVARSGQPAPNPHVGAIVVRAGQVVGLGHHERAGTWHAEVVALRRAGTKAQGATLYVTLEPCNHHGRTPPCVEAILRAGIRRVVIGCKDPNPSVRGGGAQHLAASGVAVVWSPLVAECERLIEPWVRTLGSGVR